MVFDYFGWSTRWRFPKVHVSNLLAALVQELSFPCSFTLLSFNDSFPSSLCSLGSFCRSLDVFLFVYSLTKFKVGIQSTLNLSQFGDGLPDTKWRSQTRSFSKTFFVSVSSRLIAEIQLFLLSVVRSSNSSPWCLTTDGIRKHPWVFPFPLFLPHPTTTPGPSGFVYTWGTPTWQIATVAKRWVTWVKTKNILISNNKKNN